MLQYFNPSSVSREESESRRRLENELICVAEHNVRKTATVKEARKARRVTRVGFTTLEKHIEREMAELRSITTTRNDLLSGKRTAVAPSTADDVAASQISENVKGALQQFKKSGRPLSPDKSSPSPSSSSSSSSSSSFRPRKIENNSSSRTSTSSPTSIQELRDDVKASSSALNKIAELLESHMANQLRVEQLLREALGTLGNQSQSDK